MRCPGVEILSPYVDGELDPRTTREVRNHALRCPRCADRIAAVRGLDGILAGEGSRTRRPGLVLRLVSSAAAAALLISAVWLSVPRDVPGPDLARPDPTPTAHDRVLAMARQDAQVDPDEIRGLGLGARMHLRDLLATDEPDLARGALRLAAGLGDPMLAGAVEARLDDPELTADAARVLGRLGVRSSIDALAERCREGGPVGPLAGAIARIGGRAGQQALGLLLDDEEDPRRRDALLRASGALPPQLAADILAAHLDESAAREVLRDGRDALAPILRDRLGGEQAVIAAAALGCLRDRDSVDRLARLLRRPATREAAAFALRDIGGDEAFDALLEAYTARGDDPIERALARPDSDLEERLIARYEAGGHAERRRAVRLLGLCGGENALDVLERATADPALAAVAVRALGALGRREVGAVPLLASCAARLSLRHEAVRALGLTGRPEAVQPLLALADDRTTTRLVLVALAGISGDDSIAAVLSLMDRPRCADDARRALRKHDRARIEAVLARRAERPSVARRVQPPGV